MQTGIMDPDHTWTSSRFLMSDQTAAVLTSFRTLPDEDTNGHIRVADPLSLKSGGDPYLVQVTRVETYIDDEDEEDATSIQEREHEGSADRLEPFVVKAESLVERSLKDASILSRTGPYAKLNRSSDDSRKEAPSRSVDSASELPNRSFVPPLKPASESRNAGEEASLVSGDSNQEGNSGADPTSPTDSQKEETESAASALPSSDLPQTGSGSIALSSAINDSKQDNRHQLPALFSGIRVLKKGALGDERETLAEIKQRDADRALLSLEQHVNKAKLQQTKKKNQPRSQSEITRLLQKASNEDKSAATDSSSDAVADKSILFSSKPAQKDPLDAALDLDAVRRKKKNDKELLRAIFERQLSKAPVAEEKSEVTSPSDGEDRTPGRLQAVWPPPKEDGEEKVGLRYTEAEHQAALLQLKRESKEELEKLHVSAASNNPAVLTENTRCPERRSDRALCVRPPDLRLSYKAKLLGYGSSVLSEMSFFPRDKAVETAIVKAGGSVVKDSLVHHRPVCVARVSQQWQKPNNSHPRTPYCSLNQPNTSHHNNTLWSSLEEPDIINTQEFEDLFSKATVQTKKKPLSDTYEKKNKARKPIDPLRLEQGVKFLHAYPLLQEASLLINPESQCVPLTNLLYGIQIPDQAYSRPERNTACKDGIYAKNSENVNRKFLEISDMDYRSPQPVGIESPTQNPAATMVRHLTYGIMSKSASSRKHYTCNYCGIHFNQRCKLKEHLLVHTNQATEPQMLSMQNGHTIELEVQDMEEDHLRADSDVISDTDQQAWMEDTPPPSEMADIDNLEGTEMGREMKRRKFECPTCARKFIQKSHWREHMYIHTGKPYKCSACGKNFCRANQAARHVCLSQDTDSHIMVNKQSLVLCGGEDNSQVEALFQSSERPYKCSMCAAPFASPSEVPKHQCLTERDTCVFLRLNGRMLYVAAVLTVDHSVVDLETVEALYENRAQPEELEKIRKHYETSKEDEVKLLDKPEQFLYELSQIPDFARRAHCIIFQSVFVDSISCVHRKVEIISAVSKDNRISLVDYVVSYYLRNMDENAGTEKSVFPLPEPQDLFHAAQVKFEDLAKDLRKLKKELTACVKEVEQVCENSSEEHLQPFKDKMETFVSTAQSEYETEDERLQAAQESFQEMVMYFGLRPKSGEKEVSPSFIFMLWYEFCNDFKSTWNRENKSISKERLKEAQQTVQKITAEKKVETKKTNANSLKERLRKKEAGVSSS
ncbi:formin-like [Sinocyclocheilus rhinocerous]|uniref:formin-like n=1 Tax=Sinocyclocheilus rhinocerous TaxID=307959 RepID=UPI0007BAA6FB|nr:PREDICTED: formin-like [Sinocyclocheilus rhinocerous]